MRFAGCGGLLCRRVAAGHEAADVAVERLDVIVANIQHVAGGIALDEGAILWQPCVVGQIVDHADLGADVIPAVGKEHPHTWGTAHGRGKLLAGQAVERLADKIVKREARTGKEVAVELDVQVLTDDATENSMEIGAVLRGRIIFDGGVVGAHLCGEVGPS